jgi:hypothetical protein
MSDTTENIGELRRNLEATDLRHITPSARQNEEVDISEGAKSGSQNSQEKKRNKRSSKKKTKQSKLESRRRRNNKKNSKRRQRKRNSSLDEGHDSSSLSSNASSSSSASSEYTVSSDDDSILAFGSHKITDVTDIVSKKKQRQTSTRIGKEVKKLTAAAKVYVPRPFYTDRWTIELIWVERHYHTLSGFERG